LNELTFWSYQCTKTWTIKCVVEKMNRIKTFSNWTTFVLQLKFFNHSHVIIQAPNTNSLKQHYQDINHDPNLQVSHHYENLCLQQLDCLITRAPKQLIYNCITTIPWKYNKLINKMSC
jgi:hypothetical protein